MVWKAFFSGCAIGAFGVKLYENREHLDKFESIYNPKFIGRPRPHLVNSTHPTDHEEESRSEDAEEEEKNNEYVPLLEEDRGSCRVEPQQPMYPMRCKIKQPETYVWVDPKYNKKPWEMSSNNRPPNNLIWSHNSPNNRPLPVNLSMDPWHRP